MKGERIGLGKAETSESQAERELQALLENPDNRFLNEIKANRERIENTDSSKEALEFAKEKIRARLEVGVQFNSIKFIEGVDLRDISPIGMSKIIETVLANAQQIGIGGDAFVVIDKNEIKDFPPEICYKFAIAEKTPRGRNQVTEEARLQGLFYEAAKEREEAKIGVPIPFYTLEVGDKKMIAMEKLNAKSIDHILHGNGFLPDWLDIDELCRELKAMIDHFHAHNLYHRDMHFGNVMISQKKVLEKGDKIGFIIDFGLSAEASMEEFAYKKESAGETFTYSDDYGTIKGVEVALKSLKSRQNRDA